MSYHRLRNTRTARERCHHLMIIQPFRHSTAPKFDGNPPVHKKLFCQRQNTGRTGLDDHYGPVS